MDFGKIASLFAFPPRTDKRTYATCWILISVIVGNRAQGRFHRRFVSWGRQRGNFGGSHNNLNHVSGPLEQSLGSSELSLNINVILSYSKMMLGKIEKGEGEKEKIKTCSSPTFLFDAISIFQLSTTFHEMYDVSLI